MLKRMPSARDRLAQPLEITTREAYMEYLGVLPPSIQKGGDFLGSEPYAHLRYEPVYRAYFWRGDTFYRNFLTAEMFHEWTAHKFLAAGMIWLLPQIHAQKPVAGSRFANWIAQQFEVGNTIILNSTRPLYGHAVPHCLDTEWIAGREYAALNQHTFNYKTDFYHLIQKNRALDAKQVHFVDDDDLIGIGLTYYEDWRPSTLKLICWDDPQERYINQLIKKGLEVLNS